jgi:HSP20 family molecular chaperone IbpA
MQCSHAFAAADMVVALHGELGSGGADWHLCFPLPCASSHVSVPNENETLDASKFLAPLPPSASATMAGIARLDSGLLQDFFGQGATWPMMPGQGGGGLRSLLVDVCEKPDAYVMTVDVPGAPTHRTAAPPRSERLSRHHARAKPPASSSSSSVTDETLVLCGVLAGIPKDNIALDVEGKTIKISTQSTQEEQEKESGTGPEDTQWHRVERSTQFASRALRFPENADMNQARARARARGVCAPHVLVGESGLASPCACSARY